MRSILLTILIILAGVLSASPARAWEAVPGHIATKWAADVDPNAVLPEYPRPDLVRDAWKNLNGIWDYAIADRDAGHVESWDGEILVPFPLESSLSGVQKTIAVDQRLWYRRAFVVPAEWQGQKVLLHFGAVDWSCEVRVNGQSVGTHQGGYDAFSFDITHALTNAAEQELVVSVWDPADAGFQPRGKQVGKPEGIWYTSVTGIWQTVWLEPVAPVAIQSLKLTPDIDAKTLSIETTLNSGADNVTLKAVALRDGVEVARGDAASGEILVLDIPDPQLWSPESPTLYDVQLTLQRDGETLDHAASYFGMRKIALQKDENGINRLFLNNEPLFQYGPLDQGWWPDGLYTAPTDAALRHDVEITRAMGFNMARKHVKVEPARWYYHCDQLGLLVWQDMPNGDAHIGPADLDIHRVAQSRENFYREYEALIDGRYNHPSIVMWVPFNEGWGQFDTGEVSTWTKMKDPTRLVNQVSGWADRNGGDVHDMHRYPGPGMFAVEDTRASVLGEFGGLGLPVADHLWWNKRNWGYRNLTEIDDLRFQYSALITAMRPLIGEGLAAAVYTQTTDVEGEVNGLLTYDRAVLKMGRDWLAEENAKVFTAPPRTVNLSATSESSGQSWRYTTDRPGKGWEDSAFDDSTWHEGQGAFGTKDTSGAEIRTIWDTRDIYLRKKFALAEAPAGDVFLRLYHDEDVKVYINGVEAAREKGFLTTYTLLPLPVDARAALHAGENTLAVHCRQTTGAQCIDVGVVLLEEAEQAP